MNIRITISVQVIAVEVIDNSPHNGSTIASISVINENDNAPNFINQTYSAVIPENVPAGTFVATVIRVHTQLDNSLTCDVYRCERMMMMLGFLVK